MLLITSMLYYKPEEGEVEPNGTLFQDKLDCTEERKIDQNWVK